MNPALLWVITSVLFLLGAAGTLIPALPGIGFVFAGVLLYAWFTDFAAISVATVVGLGVVALLALLADYVGSAVGAKYAGGKNWALWGTFLGGILGATAGPLGIFVGAFIGALIGALAEGQPHGNAVKIAALSVVGTLGATIVQFFLALAMIAAFFVAVFV